MDCRPRPKKVAEMTCSGGSTVYSFSCFSIEFKNTSERLGE